MIEPEASKEKGCALWEVRWKIGRHKKVQRFIWNDSHSKAFERAYIITGTGNRTMKRIRAAHYMEVVK